MPIVDGVWVEEDDAQPVVAAVAPEDLTDEDFEAEMNYEDPDADYRKLWGHDRYADEDELSSEVDLVKTPDGCAPQMRTTELTPVRRRPV